MSQFSGKTPPPLPSQHLIDNFSNQTITLTRQKINTKLLEEPSTNKLKNTLKNTLKTTLKTTLENTLVSKLKNTIENKLKTTLKNTPKNTIETTPKNTTQENFPNLPQSPESSIQALTNEYSDSDSSECSVSYNPILRKSRTVLR